MDFDICRLDVSDCDAVDSLMKANSATLGFLPREALLGYLGSGGALGAKRSDGQLAAYTLFAARRSGAVRIAHLCVSKAFNGQGLAKRLVDGLVEDSSKKDLDALDLHCRRDYPADAMWPKLKFIPLGEKPGRGSSGKTLTYWRRTLKSSTQADFFYGASDTQGIEVTTRPPAPDWAGFALPGT
ncbi:MAG: GNAT family N-acetyltransferase, partial [Gammaproteobacteria bacterium]|nr:GNAT family N-acetyltransferase [Gammaproteobacteria bacterium]